MIKTAVILLNLGGPDSKNAIRPFLQNFFMDRNIIDLPLPFRYILAWLIAKKRSGREASESYGALGDKSPLLENSQAQAKALQKQLGKDFKTFVCMRYWHPMSPQIVREVRDWGADRIIILPLYPQFSTATTRSSLQVWKKAMFEVGYKCPTSTICCYPFNDGFIQASAENIKAKITGAAKDGYQNPRILFSAHGLPEKTIKGGDPYQWQCEQGAEKIAAALDLKKENWAICYQSRVGPMKWIGPSLDEELLRAVQDKKAVVIYPHAFTQEHVETLVELDIEYKEEANHMGLKGYYRAETVGTHPAYIEGLTALIYAHLNEAGVKTEGLKTICPENFGGCCMRNAQSIV